MSSLTTSPVCADCGAPTLRNGPGHDCPSPWYKRHGTAVEYAVFLLHTDTWNEHVRCKGRGEAIALAREQLRLGARAAQVQGRGTPRHPTPKGEVLAWLGVREGYRRDLAVGALAPRAELERVEVVFA